MATEKRKAYMREYNKKYHAKRKEELNARRKERYWADVEVTV